MATHQDAYPVDLLERRIAAVSGGDDLPGLDYSYYDPEDLSATAKEDVSVDGDGTMYMFVKRPPPMTFLDRKTGNGYWRPNDSRKMVKNSKGEEVVSKASLSFYYLKPTDDGSGINGCRSERTLWRMHEFASVADERIALRVVYKRA
ncbi:unnamed protein product [Linum trigynum]|uniref:NAC domain-containing protein n=1 Tax=Linum trigynum TaxID=586398 RepID=A0AAV2CQ70_9ROSI